MPPMPRVQSAFMARAHVIRSPFARRNPAMTHRIACTLALALCIAAGMAVGQDTASSGESRTGDAWVDGRLEDINRYAARYREPFVDELARYQGAPRELVTDLLANRRWAPGDVYYACAIAQVIGRPCRYVVDAWNRDSTGGWGAVAQRLGIQPGSAEFQRLKRGFVPSYDRWGRPIELDDALRRAFPDRKRAADAARPGGSAQPASAKPPASKPAASKASGKGNARD